VTAPAATPRRRLGRNVVVLAAVSLLTDVSSEMIYPLLPLFLAGTLGASAGLVGLIEGGAETTAAFLKLGSGWWSDRLRRRKPLVVLGYALSSAVRPMVALAQGAGHVLAVRLADRVGKGLRTSPRDALIADSVDPAVRGRAFGLHRAADHAGAVVGPLLAAAVLWAAPATPLRLVFALAALPAALAVLVLVVGVREGPRPPPPVAAPGAAAEAPAAGPAPLGRAFWSYLAAVLLFTLGNSSDAFLLLRATELGVAQPLVPVLWAVFHVVKAATSVPGGGLSDRLGRRPLIVAGWVLYALVYLGFARAGAPWQAWALFLAYGAFYGLTEGTEKALVADLVPAARRGAAYGLYHLAVGLGALPASLLFGLLWDRLGAPAAFTCGAALAAAAVVLLVGLRGRPGPAGGLHARAAGR
jgi:MFS family permease